jgi:hypothetical protein
MVPFFYKDSKIGFSYSSCCWCFCQHTLALRNTQQRRATFWEHQHGQKKEVDNLPADDKSALLRVIGGFLRDVKTKQAYAS